MWSRRKSLNLREKFRRRTESVPAARKGDGNVKRRVTYRPSKAQGAFGVVWGVVFILIGFCVVIPSFGPFGILWTILAIGITAMNGYQAFGKKYAGPEINIEEDEQGVQQGEFDRSGEDHNHISSIGPSVKSRLEQLESLREAGLVTPQEYEQKRREILREL